MARSSTLKTISAVLLAVLILSMLAACAAPAAPVAPTAAPAQPTAAPEPTKAPEPTAAPEPTKAAEQPTAAPATAAPEPTVAPTEASAASGEPVPGGTLIVGSPQEPETLNPVLSSQTIADAVSSLVIEGLVEIDADGKYVPVLAEALPEVSDDGLTVTYTLKKDLKWSNGDAVTCDDVKFTYDVILGDLSQVSTSGYKDIDSIECADGGKVVVTFAKLYAPYLRLFSYIIPKSAGDPTKLDSWEYNRMPVGTGPWVLKEWKAGDQMVFEKNPNYRVAGQPYLDGVIIKILPSREVGMQLIGTGEIAALWDLIEADFPALEEMKDKGVTWASAVTGENELILFNFADPTVDAPADAAKNPHPILSDLKVREAFQMGIDKALIVETLLGNKVKVGTTVLPVGQFACPQEPSKYDPEAAKALLEEAGWKAGSDGIREKDGVRLSLKYQTTSGNKLREDTQQAIVEMLKEVGIELTIENVPSDVLFAGWDSNGLRKHGNFDVIMYTTGPGIDPDSHLFGNYHSASIPTADNGGSGSNYSRWANATVDKAIDDASSVTDPAERAKQYCVVAAEINKDLPRIFLYERLAITGVRTEVQNFRVSPGPRDFTTDSATWWFKK